MSDQKKPRQPVLKPNKNDDNSSGVGVSSENTEDHNPVLLSGKGYYQKSNPPYVLMVIALVGISIVCWKMWSYRNKEVVIESPSHARESAERIESLR